MSTLSLEIPAHARMRVRCPDDDGSGRHLALDLRQPAGASIVAGVMSIAGQCPCGSTTVVLPARGR